MQRSRLGAEQEAAKVARMVRTCVLVRKCVGQRGARGPAEGREGAGGSCRGELRRFG